LAGYSLPSTSYSLLTARAPADRVFSHALNTVNKIRTGTEKPPAVTRLKLYGLYKQSMGMAAPADQIANDDLC